MKKKNNNNKPKILVIHGPNLDLLGRREKQIYGKINLKELNQLLKKEARKLDVSLQVFQSNSEGDIVNKISSSLGEIDFMIINPAAYTHTSVAIRDALLAVEIPAIEVHISNIFKREPFRKKSLISDVVIGVISGLGIESYILALGAAKKILKNTKY